jgi:hypothetical protein
MLTALQRLRHYVRTGFGDSEDSYGNEEIPLMGLLQGNGAAGVGFNAIASVIIAMMKEEGFGFHHWSAITREVIDLVCFSFVDDTDLIHSGHSVDTTGEQVFASMQSVLDHWEGALRATGGAVALDKSYWYLIDFKWNRTTHRWDYRPHDEVEGVLTLHNRDTDLREAIPRLPIHEARKSLGIFVRHDGVMDDEFAYLLGKAREWADNVRTGHINRNDAWYTLDCTIMKTL